MNDGGGGMGADRGSFYIDGWGPLMVIIVATMLNRKE